MGMHFTCLIDLSYIKESTIYAVIGFLRGDEINNK